MVPAAFEMFAVWGFKNRSSLTYIFKESTHPIENSMDITVTRTIHSERGKDIGKILPGTLVICYPGHKAIDMLLYTLQEYLLFIQVSTSPYQSHSSSRDDVLTMKMIEGESVYQYYATRAVTKVNHKWQPKWQPSKIQSHLTYKRYMENTYYCYVTSTPQSKQSNINKIMLVAAEQLRCLGEEYRYFVQQ
jgi:hypothetical protein